MKRTLCILLVLVACLVLTSCKDDRYDDLEKRVKALEKEQGTPTPTVKQTGVQPANGNYSSDKKTTAAGGVISEIGGGDMVTNTPTPSPIVCYYPLDSVSVDDIVKEVDTLLSNVPKEGQTADEYLSTFVTTPYRESSFSGSNTRVDISFINYNDNKTYTEFISGYTFYGDYGCGVQTEMDGTLSYVTDESGFIGITTVSLQVKGYEKAVSIYEALWNKEKEFYDLTNMKENREGTSWNITLPKPGHGLVVIGLSKESDDLYRIVVRRVIYK